jgi:four helix bundle protein
LRDVRELAVWRKAHRLTLDIYRSTAGFPKEEVYGLTSQLRRSSSSIPANIAEGCGRGSRIDLARFLQIALGSASEVEYHIILAHDLGLLSQRESAQLIDNATQIKRMLTAFIQRLRADDDNRNAVNEAAADYDWIADEP